MRIKSILLLLLVPLVITARAQLGSPSAVRLNDAGDHYILENGLLGLKIPKASTYNAASPRQTLAPVQSVIYRDNTFSDLSANYIRSVNAPTGMTVTIEQQTNDEVRLQVRYTFNKEARPYYQGEAGPGYYASTISLKKGMQSAMITESTDYDVSWDVNTARGLNPTRGQYRGSIGNNDINYGYEWESGNKIPYRAWNQRPSKDALLDLSYGSGREYRLQLWECGGNPAAGWYYQFYNDQPGATDNLVGFFHGRPSLLKGAHASSVRYRANADGLTSLRGDRDASGNFHYVWINQSNELMYLQTDASGNPSGAAAPIATGLRDPFLHIRNGTTPEVVAVDPAGTNGGTVVKLRKQANGSFTASNLSLNLPVPMESDRTMMAFTASAANYDFVLVSGGISNNRRQYYLFNAAPGSNTYTLSGTLELMIFWTQLAVPDMHALPDGSVQVLYPNFGGHISVARIAPGQNSFDPAYDHMYLYYQYNAFNPPLTVTVGYAPLIDRASNNAFAFIANGYHGLLKPADNILGKGGYTPTSFASGTEMNEPAGTHRKSVAADAAGNALVFNAGLFYEYIAATNTWRALTSVNNTNIAQAYIAYNNSNQTFYITALHSGALKRFSFQLGNNSFTELNTLADAGNSASIELFIDRRGPDNRWHPEKIFQWGLYVGTKSADLKPVAQYQGIGLELNKQSGFANKIDAIVNNPAQVVSGYSQAAIYVDAAKMQALMNRVKTEPAFYSLVWNAEFDYRTLIEAWKNPATSGVALRDQLLARKPQIIDNYKNKDGIYDLAYQYWMGLRGFRVEMLQAAGILADNAIPKTAQQQQDLKDLVKIYGRILWDDDNAPMQNYYDVYQNSGINFGTANMPVMYKGGRSFTALLLSPDTEFAGRAAEVITETQNVINSEFTNDCGAPFGSSHYFAEAGSEPTLFTMLQIKQAGLGNLFASNAAKVRNFGNFMVSLSTPPNPRFQNYRKTVSIGDAFEGSVAAYGLLGTGLLGGSSNQLGKQLLTIFTNGRLRGTLAGSVMFAVDLGTNHNEPFTAKSSNVDGYLSHLRSDAGGDNETGVWMTNGSAYFDHRHDDAGQVQVYALKAPLSLGWSSFYAPQSSHAGMKAVVMPESLFPQWTSSAQPITDPITSLHTWATNYTQEFGRFGHSDFAQARMETPLQGGLNWNRQVRNILLENNMPVIVIRDELKNSSNQPLANCIWSMPFMSQGAIQTPAGAVTPEDRLWLTSGALQQHPAATATQNLGVGLSRFSFTGQNFSTSLHASGGINWDVYSLANEARQFNTSQWGNNYIPTPENEEYSLVYNTGGDNPYRERQQFLRVKGNGSFFTVILPFRKGTAPYHNSVTTNTFNDEMHIDLGNGKQLRLGKESMFYNKGTNKVHALYSNTYYAYDGVELSGGAVEVVMEPNRVLIRLNGNAGVRSIKIPRLNYVLSGNDNTVSFTHTSATTDVTVNYAGTGVCRAPDDPADVYKEIVFVPGPGVCELQLNTNSPICAGSNLNLYAYTGTVGATFSWTGPNGFASSLQNPVITNATTAATGTYTCTMNHAICGYPIVKTIKIAVIGSTAPVASYGSANCEVVSNVGVGNQWYFNTVNNAATATPISGATSISHIATQTGFYFVRLQGPGCNSPFSNGVYFTPPYCSSVYKAQPTDATETITTAGNGISIFPNPANDRITISGIADYKDLQVELVNEAGQIMHQQRVTANATQLSITLSPRYAGGVYTLYFRHRSGVVTKKLVIKR